MTDQTARQRRGPVFKIPLTKWQRRQNHLREQLSNNRALIGFTPDGQAVVNPVQAELRRLFKGIVSRSAAARLEGMAGTPKRLRKDPSTRKARFNGEFVPARSRFAGQGHGEVTYVPVEQANRLTTEGGREARRVRLAERDERSAEYRAGLARKVAEMAAQEASEASA